MREKLFKTVIFFMSLSAGLLTTAISVADERDDAIERLREKYSRSKKGNNLKEEGGLGSIHKEDNHFYWSATFLQIDKKFSSPTTSDTGSPNGYSMAVGFTFNSYIAAEIALVDLGEIKGGVPGQKTALRSNSIDFSAIGKLPLVKDWNAYAVAGISGWSSQRDERGSSVLTRYEDSGTDFYYGAGINYSLNDYVDIFAEYKHYSFEPTFNMVASDVEVDTIAIGFRWVFSWWRD